MPRNAQPFAPGNDRVFINRNSKAFSAVSKPVPSPSQTSGSLQDQVEALIATSMKLSQEQEEVLSAIEKLATIAEVVREAGTLIQTHISNLRTVANQLESGQATAPPPSLSVFADGQGPAGWFLQQAVQPVEVGGVQAAPPLWPVDQG